VGGGHGQVLPTEVATATELRDAALQMVLQETYELFRLLHGSIRTRLAQSEVRLTLLARTTPLHARWPRALNSLLPTIAEHGGRRATRAGGRS
jgi:hypothetical protein